MARAGWYFYEPDTKNCLLCGRETNVSLPFRHDVSELVENTVAVPIHRSCYIGRILWFLGQFILITLLLALLLGIAEFYAFRALWGWSTLPVYVIIINIIIGIPFGAWSGMENYIRLIDKINGYIHLKTYPLD